MNILHINTLTKGGAANAAIRLHKGLLGLGHKSSFLTLASDSNSIPNHITFPQFSKYGLSFPKRIKNKLAIKQLASVKRAVDSKEITDPIECFSSPETDYKLAEFINNELDVDIIHLHWVANFLDYEEFFSKIKKPVVWTLHDQNPFSSYWHYSQDHIKNDKAMWLHIEYLKIKENSIHSSSSQIHIVSPSKWLMQESETSNAFHQLPHSHIHNGIDTSIYKVCSVKPESLLNFKETNNLLFGLFICQSISNKRKGMELLIEAIKSLPSNINLKFIAVGKLDKETRKALPDDILTTDEINDESELAKLYNFADFTIIPSLQDNLPNTMLESLCCGTPVLGTPAGGIPEVINEHSFGITSRDFKPESLAQIIIEFTKRNKEFVRDEISHKAQRYFSMNIQANNYLKLYDQIITHKHNFNN